MTRRNTLKTRLESGEPIAAIWHDLGSAEVAELLVHTGWDIVIVDCEHGPATVEDAIPIIRAIEAAGGQAVLRVPEGTDAVLKRALDKGVHSLMVPMVDSAAVAQRIAASCLYPPRGQRGYAAPILRASHYGAIPDYAQARAHHELLLMIQIEHVDAIEAIPEIAAVEGVDMIFIGPNDLAASMGHLEDMAHPDVRAAISRAEDLARAAGVMLGTVLWADHDYGSLRKAGYHFIGGACDVALLTQSSREAREAARRLLA